MKKREIGADSEKTYVRLLRAALEVFSERGYAGATTREIARRAGQNQPLISYYFDGKEDLWKAAVDLAFSEFDLALDRIVAQGGERPTQFSAVVQAFVSGVAENPAWAAFMIYEGMQDNERTAWMIDKWIRPMTLRVDSILTGTTKRKNSKASKISMTSIHWIMAGSAYIFPMHKLVQSVTNVDVRSKEFIDAHVRNLVRAMEIGMPDV